MPGLSGLVPGRRPVSDAHRAQLTLHQQQVNTAVGVHQLTILAPGSIDAPPRSHDHIERYGKHSADSSRTAELARDRWFD
ncbi:hypothetical protein ABT126_40220 [Streptomyces sp. NPDC002012]|uniref:hypothetical protein n=1 Tax=unclassified Streptomyces TaxID=2593676 RepID=UPI00332764B8